MKITPLEDWIVEKSGIRDRNLKALEEYQLARIKKVISMVREKSRFYHELLEDIDEYNINSFKEFSKIPFTYPTQLSENSMDFVCVPQSQIKRIVTLRSSGTSGEEKRIYFSERDLNLTIDFFKVGMSCLTDKNDRVLVLLPGESYGSIGDLLKKALNESGIECFIHGVITDMDRAAEDIIDNDITCLVGIPIQILKLSRIRSDLFDSNIKKILLSTDYVPDAIVHELTDKYGCRVFTHYGMTETGYGGGVECEALDGYHMRDADLYYEIINPSTGEMVPNGQAGEVVVTTLTREAMPLIRYKTGDIASYSDEKCDCGTFLKKMNKVLGRIDNGVFVRDGIFLTLRELDEAVFNLKEVLDYSAYITKENILTVEIFSDSSIIKQYAEESIGNLLYEKLCGTADFKVIVSNEGNIGKITNSMVKRKIKDFRGV